VTESNVILLGAFRRLDEVRISSLANEYNTIGKDRGAIVLAVRVLRFALSQPAINEVVEFIGICSG
jgi:hypothetical protein